MKPIVTILREGPAHSFGWLHRHELDTTSIQFWETPRGKSIAVPKKMSKHVVQIDSMDAYVPWVYEYVAETGEKIQSVNRPS